jgi:uncharacterized protein
MGRSDKMQALKRWTAARLQAILWMVLALGFCSLPLVAGSEVFRPVTKAQANHWLQSYNQAMQAYRAGQYVTAYQRFRVLADFGSAGAQTMIGHLYWTGKGVEQAPGKAFMWFHRAAQRGYVPAQLATGRAYALGKGIGRDDVKAAMWLSLVDARGAPAQRAQAGPELARVMARLTADELQMLHDLKQHWRPDVALMP